VEIIQERLEREYNLNLIFTAPNVEYWIKTQSRQLVTEPSPGDTPEAARLIAEGYVRVRNPSEFPDEVKIDEILEPWVKLSVITPNSYMGGVMELVKSHRGSFGPTEFIDETRVNLHFELPLSEVIVDFYDSLKSISSGYASMDYEQCGLRPGNLEKLTILVHDREVDAFAQIVPRERAGYAGRKIIEQLKEVIPKQLFTFKIQAAIGAKVIATVSKGAMRKDVTAKLYGGDRTRKDKLLKKQKAGKKRMKMIGQVEVPQEAFMAVMKR